MNAVSSRSLEITITIVMYKVTLNHSNRKVLRKPGPLKCITQHIMIFGVGLDTHPMHRLIYPSRED